MSKRLTIGRVFVVSVLVVYFLLGILSTGGVALPTSVLVLVLVLWFSVYKLRHKGLGNRGLTMKMRADLEGTLEGIKERMAQQEAHRLATLEQEEQARLERERRRAERERRRASSPTRDPADSEYAEIIESRVRERERSGRESEGP
jgi:ABC-type transport system involved in cytochrome bd biosynthesis fused ATPase/permease subunit